MVQKLILTPEKKSLRHQLNKPLLTFSDKKLLYLVDSGSWLINLALTNNINYSYPVGRAVNIVGDYSTGKTALACDLVNVIWYIEHLTNKKKVKIYYDEGEWAFDFDLAMKFNMPLEHIYGLRERICFKCYAIKKQKDILKCPNCGTTLELKKSEKPFITSRKIEDLYNNLKYITKEEQDYDIILYIIDSLDSLQDAREIKHIEKKGIEKQDMGGSKARALSQMFRDCIFGINNSNVLLFIVSQVRDKIGITFGKTQTRSGGNALDHYLSIIIWLSEMSKITAPNGMNQGVKIRALIDKNKIGERYNTVSFDILDRYGVDNIGSAVHFLWERNYFTKNGNYISWIDGKSYYQPQLIEKAINDKQTELKLKHMLQDCWNQLIAEAAINRPPKWS